MGCYRGGRRRSTWRHVYYRKSILLAELDTPMQHLPPPTPFVSLPFDATPLSPTTRNNHDDPPTPRTMDRQIQLAEVEHKLKKATQLARTQRMRDELAVKAYAKLVGITKKPVAEQSGREKAFVTHMDFLEGKYALSQRALSVDGGSALDDTLESLESGASPIATNAPPAELSMSALSSMAMKHMRKMERQSDHRRWPLGLPRRRTSSPVLAAR